MRLRGHVHACPVVEHRRVVWQLGEGTDLPEVALGVGDERLVAHLEVAGGSDPTTQRPSRTDLRPPLAGEVAGVARMRPGLGHDPRRYGEEGEAGVTAVADEVNEARVREEPVEERELLHVQRRLVAPAALSVHVRVCLEDRGDRLTGLRTGLESCPDGLGRDAPFRERRQAAEVVEKPFRVDSAPVALGDLGHEVRLVRDG